MLIKHFDDMARLFDVKMTDFIDLRHNWWDDVGTFYCKTSGIASDGHYLDVS